VFGAGFGACRVPNHKIKQAGAMLVGWGPDKYRLEAAGCRGLGALHSKNRLPPGGGRRWGVCFVCGVGGKVTRGSVLGLLSGGAGFAHFVKQEVMVGAGGVHLHVQVLKQREQAEVRPVDEQEVLAAAQFAQLGDFAA